MNIKQLHSFLVVAQEHQITAAAKRLYTSQPPLSYQMKQLEKEVGCPLLKRTAHGIELTPQGQLFQQYAEKIVGLANSAKKMVSDSANGTSGTIRIGLISSAAQAVINSRLQSLAADYPRVSIEITEGNTFELVKKINHGPSTWQLSAPPSIRWESTIANYLTSKSLPFLTVTIFTCQPAQLTSLPCKTNR